MRREYVFSLLGFLGGFIVAAFVFWQPSVPSDIAPSALSEVAPRREAGTASRDERPRTRMVVPARESDIAAPIADSAPQPKGPAEIFHEAIGKLNVMDHDRKEAAINSLVEQLRAAGPEGLKVLRDYFRAGQDVKLGYTHTDANDVSIHTLREALINRLGAWPASERLALTREILGTTSRISEASIAIRQMEKCAPGEYRAEAIQTLQKVAANSDLKSAAENGGTALFYMMKKLKAAELLPVAEAVASSDPSMVRELARSLDALPADARAQALQRLFSNEAMTRSLARDPWTLQSLNYSEPVIAQNVAQFFASNTDKKFRENFLQGIAQNMSFNSDGAADRVGKLQSRAAFLDTIAPQCNTPVLQERLQDAREALQKAIANPDDNGLTKRGSGTLILNSTGNVFSGSTRIAAPGSIQISTTAEKKR